MERVFLTIQSRGTVALTPDVRRRHRLEEPGAQVELIEREDGVIELHPKVAVAADQQWFWTERWQQMEREAQREIDAGNATTSDTAAAFLDSLDAPGATSRSSRRPRRSSAITAGCRTVTRPSSARTFPRSTTPQRKQRMGIRIHGRLRSG